MPDSSSPSRGTYLSTQRALRTTDATATTFKSIPVYAGCAVYILVNFLVRVEGTTGDVMGGKIEGWFYDVSGTATAVGAQETLTVQSDGTDAWTFALAASGGNAVLTATGAAATNIDWYADIQVREIKVPSSSF